MDHEAVPSPVSVFEARQKLVCEHGNLDSTWELGSCIFRAKGFAMMELCLICLTYASGLLVADNTLLSWNSMPRKAMLR
jgi:hypothetical protein